MPRAIELLEARIESGSTGKGTALAQLAQFQADATTPLFTAIPENQSIKVKRNQKEIKKAAFQNSLPNKASPSAKYFWSAKGVPLKSLPRSAPQPINFRQPCRKGVPLISGNWPIHFKPY
jgi:hypothetical protein